MKKMNLFFFAVVIGLITMCSSVITSLDAEHFDEKLKQTPNPQLVDVRTFSEFAQGYLSGAILIDIRKPTSFDSLINQLDRTQPVFVYCRLGRRSLDAAKILEKKKFTKVYNLRGGIIEWKEKGMEVVIDD